jgi:murein DD-endopeptidase MepM/ murein hydrolase activator NlpD
MWSFLAEFTKNLDGAYTVVVMDERGVDEPRRYEVQPRRVLTAWGSSLLMVSLLVVGIIAFTPIRQLIPGYGTDEIRRAARMNNQRVAALSDSIRAQQRYIEHLRSLITGEIDTANVSDVSLPVKRHAATPSPFRTVGASGTGRQHVAPGTAGQEALASARAVGIVPKHPGRVQKAPTGPALPMRPPVDGFLTRGFDARAGHFAIDIAVESGTPVRCVRDGYVVFADWTQAGGYTVAVQHAEGYLTVYKHNKRLLKRVGDRVQSRETIAISGNTGEITTGPHLHFELWRNGLAQNPREYFVGW